MYSTNCCFNSCATAVRSKVCTPLIAASTAVRNKVCTPLIAASTAVRSKVCTPLIAASTAVRSKVCTPLIAASTAARSRKSETRMTARFLPSNGQEINLAQPKTDVLALHLTFHGFSPFNC